MARPGRPAPDDFRRELLQKGRIQAAVLWVTGTAVGLFTLEIPYPQWLTTPQVWVLVAIALAGAGLSLAVPQDRVRLEVLIFFLSALAIAGVTIATWFTNGLQPQFIILYALVAGAASLIASGPTAAAITAACGLIPLLFVLWFPDRRVFRQVLLQIPSQTLVALFAYRLTQYLTQDRKEKQRLAVVAKTSRILTSLDPDALLEATADHLLEVTRSNACFISLIEQPGDYLVNRIVRFVPGTFEPGEEEAVRRLRFKVGEGLTGWVAAHGEPVLCGNPLADPRAKQIPGTSPVEESMIVVPFRVGGQVAGVIRISREGLYQYTEEDLQLCEILANHVSAAMEKAWLYQEARRLAVTDDLTGLGNARGLESRLFEEVARARRYNRPLSLVIIDSDSLKQINDQFGHLRGNELIRMMAEVIRENVRACDIPFRYAGDEFVILMPETGADEARIAAERIRRAIEERGLMIDGQRITVTASVGVATFPDHASDAEDLIRKADMAMYAAKAEGKNRVVVSGRPA